MYGNVMIDRGIWGLTFPLTPSPDSPAFQGFLGYTWQPGAPNQLAQAKAET